MEKEGLKPLHLQLKDTHTIMLSNSQGEGTADILVHEVENLVKMSDRIFCLDYEGLNGNDFFHTWNYHRYYAAACCI